MRKEFLIKVDPYQKTYGVNKKLVKCRKCRRKKLMMRCFRKIVNNKKRSAISKKICIYINLENFFLSETQIYESVYLKKHKLFIGYIKIDFILQKTHQDKIFSSYIYLVQFIVETTSIAYRLSVPVSPPQCCL